MSYEKMRDEGNIESEYWNILHTLNGFSAFKINFNMFGRFIQVHKHSLRFLSGYTGGIYRISETTRVLDPSANPLAESVKIVCANYIRLSCDEMEDITLTTSELYNLVVNHKFIVLDVTEV